MTSTSDYGINNVCIRPRVASVYPNEEAEGGQKSKARQTAMSYSTPITSSLSQDPCSVEWGNMFCCIVPLNRELDIYRVCRSLEHMIGLLLVLVVSVMPVKWSLVYAHRFCAVDIFFWNITGCQAVSPVAKFHHVLERGFMIQPVILIFIKCLSANQDQLFYILVLSYLVEKYRIYVFKKICKHI